MSKLFYIAIAIQIYLAYQLHVTNKKLDSFFEMFTIVKRNTK